MPFHSILYSNLAQRVDAQLPARHDGRRTDEHLGVIETDDLDVALSSRPTGQVGSALSRAQTLASREERSRPQSVRLLGIPIRNDTLKSTLDWIAQRARHRVPTTITFANAHCLNIACRNLPYAAALRASSRVLADGSGVRLAFRFNGFDLADNLNGTDLFPHLCALAERDGLSMYLLGAAPGVAEAAARNQRRRYPNLRIAGARHGFFGADETASVIDAINESGADIVLVAMGVPLQELWLSRHREQLDAPMTLAVGGLFDFYSGRISRAPLGLRKCGMEWLWRLAMEPGRMWRRYLLGNPLFALRAWREARARARASHYIGHVPPGRACLTALERLRWRSGVEIATAAKRALDVTVAGIVLTLASPLLALTTLAIRIESPGPILFRQRRIGLRGKPFGLWKFRSMYVHSERRRAELLGANEMRGSVLFKMRRDPRVTYVGRFIRRFSIDELPQLWNVLRGDMSLVGPRPALPDEVAQYALRDRQRLLAAPGITCTWQVSGRSDLPFEQQVLMDLSYVHEGGLGRDLALLAKTLPAVVSGRGAY